MLLPQSAKALCLVNHYGQKNFLIMSIYNRTDMLLRMTNRIGPLGDLDGVVEQIILFYAQSHTNTIPHIVEWKHVGFLIDLFRTPEWNHTTYDV